MFNEVTQCRCCGGEDLFEYLDLGMQPLANSYHRGEGDLPAYPLKVNLCEDCYHSQLSIVVEPSRMFKHYLYVSGTTKTFTNHCENFASDAIKYWKKRRDKKNRISVLDVACNDGTLLESFRKQGCLVQGVDPAENLREITKKKRIRVKVGYWGDGSMVGSLGRYDIITGTNVFAHVNDTKGFLEDSLKCLVEDGYIILEFPYCDRMIDNCEFDTIYHEHLSYFLVNSMKTLVEQTGLCIENIKQTSIHGGSIRFFLTRGESHCETVDKLIEKEREVGLLDKKEYVDFSLKVERNKLELMDMVNDLKSAGKKVIGYGASAKGNTMLNYFGLDLDYIVDDNELKWGYLTPGRNIQIRPTTDLKNEEELYIVILAWNFFAEIKKRIEDTTGKVHHYIRYVPEVTCS